MAKCHICGKTSTKLKKCSVCGKNTCEECMARPNICYTCYDELT